MDRKDIVDIKYKFLYLVVLILDAIQTAVIIIVVIAAIFAFRIVSGLLPFVCSASKTNNGQNNSMSLTFSSNSTSTDDPCGFTGYHLWLARATLVLIAFIVIMGTNTLTSSLLKALAEKVTLEECYYWRTTGCRRGSECALLHKEKHKG